MWNVLLPSYIPVLYNALKCLQTGAAMITMMKDNGISEVEPRFRTIENKSVKLICHGLQWYTR